MMATKNIAAIIIFSVAYMLSFQSCKEVGPIVDLGNNPIDTTLIDTAYTIATLPPAQSKVVLIEDFTGVRCINCPDGHEQAANIEAANPGRVIAISLHSDFLGVAYVGQPELRIPEAQDLENLLGPAPAKPVAAIDRVLFNGETDILQFLQQWSGRTNEQLTKNVTVNIALENRLETTDNGVNIIAKATATYLQNTTAENRITLVLIEENVVAAQLTNSGVDSNYVHKNVARAFLTRFNGNVITAEKNSGTVVVKEFKLNNIPAAWKLNDLKVVAFIHEFGSSQKVLQTAVEGVM
jgi:hypothetical protein